jgi:hypothetical protein
MSQVHIAQWVNPTQNTDGTAFASTDFAGIQIEIDGQPAVSVPEASEITSFDLSTLAIWSTLKSGSHTATLAITNKEGNTSAFSAVATFPILAVPMAPTGLTVA